MLLRNPSLQDNLFICKHVVSRLVTGSPLHLAHDINVSLALELLSSLFFPGT
jgi:hypothetical protein